MIGVFMDLLGYLPLGTGVFTLLVVHGIAVKLRRGLARRGFAWSWVLFGIVATGASALIWLLSMLLTLRLLSPFPVLFIATLAIALFPVLAVPFAAAHRTVANPDHA